MRRLIRWAVSLGGLLLLIPYPAYGQTCTAPCVQQAAASADWAFPNSVSITLTGIAAHDAVIVTLGIGCNRTFAPDQCFAPGVSDTNANAFSTVGGFDVTEESALYTLYGCDMNAGNDTITFTANGTGIPQELAVIAQEFTSSDHSGPFACQDNNNLFGHPRDQTVFNQSIGTGPSTTVAIPCCGETSFRVTTNILTWGAAYDRRSNHTWTVTGTPSPTINYQLHPTCSACPGGFSGQSLVVVSDLVANIASPAPPYSFSFSWTGTSTDYLENQILAFDQANTLPPENVGVLKKRVMIFP